MESCDSPFTRCWVPTVEVACQDSACLLSTPSTTQTVRTQDTVATAAVTTTVNKDRFAPPFSWYLFIAREIFLTKMLQACNVVSWCVIYYLHSFLWWKHSKKGLSYFLYWCMLHKLIKFGNLHTNGRLFYRVKFLFFWNPPISLFIDANNKDMLSSSTHFF
jgi:hypothetical protein